MPNISFGMAKQKKVLKKTTYLCDLAAGTIVYIVNKSTQSNTQSDKESIFRSYKAFLLIKRQRQPSQQKNEEKH